MTLRRIAGPPVALGGIALLVYVLFDYLFDPVSKDTFVDLVRGTGISAMLIAVGITWSMDKVYGGSKANEHARNNAGSDSEQPT